MNLAVAGGAVCTLDGLINRVVATKRWSIDCLSLRELSMIQTSLCVGLVFCEKVVVEERSRNITLINSFHKLPVDELPTTAAPFYLYFSLTDGIGSGMVMIEILDPISLSAVHVARLSIHMDNPTKPKRFIVPITGCPLDTAGRFQATLNVDGEPVASAIFTVAVVEE